MITFSKYISKKFKDKEVLVQISDIRQIKGILTAVRGDYILLSFKGKKTIPINKILAVEEYEK